MSQFPIDSEEMELRQDKDFIDSLKMVGEGGPGFDQSKKNDEGEAKDRDLPRAYQ